jgi:hypothetical protein
MPIRKITQSGASSEMKEIKQITLSEIVKYQRANSTSPTNWIIAIIIIVFSLTICVQVFDSMDGHFTVSDIQAKKCMVDFQENSCNPLKLDGKCVELLSCIQKEENAGIVTKSWTFFNFSVTEIKENILFPSIMIALVLLFQIAKTMRKQEGNDESLTNE